MNIRYFLELMRSYKLLIVKILFYEALYMMRGFKGNSFDIINNIKANSNIPCPYFFLNKINNFLKKRKINSFFDLGCGSGRSIYFFNTKYKINYFGIEYNEKAYDKSKKLFEKFKNVEIINDNFMNFDFLKKNADCYFINDPLKDTNEFNNLILKIIEYNKISNKLIYLIFVNIKKDKLNILKKYELINFLNLDTRGFYIYSNQKKINEK